MKCQEMQVAYVPIGLVEFVKSQCLEDSTGHDWHHVQRVHQLAIHLALAEGADPIVVAHAALLHDVWDHKLGFSESDQDQGVSNALTFYAPTLSQTQCEAIVLAIASVSYKGGRNPHSAQSLEAKIVQDADRLDALGAIGIARTFAYGGSRNRPLYAASGKAGHDSLQHFEDKLLKLKDLMHTNTAKVIALERHQFMETYLAQFYKELHESS